MLLTTACLIVSTYIFKAGFDLMQARNPPDTLFLLALPFDCLERNLCLTSMTCVPSFTGFATELRKVLLADF
jgi:hypothetical protein